MESMSADVTFRTSAGVVKATSARSSAQGKHQGRQVELSPTELVDAGELYAAPAVVVDRSSTQSNTVSWTLGVSSDALDEGLDGTIEVGGFQW